MKKVLLFLLTFAIFTSSVFAFAADNVTVEIDGALVDCKDINGNEVPPMLIDGTTYLPVRAIASALNLEIEWDDSSKSVFINGKPENAEPGDNVNIYINGSKFIAKDAGGKTVNPILSGGTTYLPVRAIGEAFEKRVEWVQETKTVKLTTPILKTDFDENKTYAIINCASKKAITVQGSGLALEDFNSCTNQGFKFAPSFNTGYYNITSIENGKNFDVNGNSKAPGGKIITYNPSDADNQKFAIEALNDGFIIYARSSKLPIENSADNIKQNTLRESLVQRWDIVEITPKEKADVTVYRALSANGLYLSDSEKLTASSNTDLWLFVPNDDGEYIITNKNTGKSLDVANNSKQAGDSIITYKTSGDNNQRWIFEKNPDGTYLIKSVHSSLYLTISGNSIIQAEKDSSAVQCWAITTVE